MYVDHVWHIAASSEPLQSFRFIYSLKGYGAKCPACVYFLASHNQTMTAAVQEMAQTRCLSVLMSEASVSMSS